MTFTQKKTKTEPEVFEDLEFEDLDPRTIKAAIVVLRDQGRDDLAEQLSDAYYAAKKRLGVALPSR